jgi:crotonobetainyl-CoA:carnitine CoA-transferase CaiB-like acyl-CoA transferase
MREAPADPITSGALSGIRVIEIGQMISGPFCGHLFADHGADVVKVESCEGDIMRRWGGMHRGLGLYWPVISRGKRSVTLDLRVPAGQQALLRLASTADVIVENFRPGTLERWGIGPAELRRSNPGLTLVRITGFGQDGPYRDRAGFGSVAEAMSGFRHLSGEPGRPPVRVGISIADSLAGTHGFIGALLALLARSRNPQLPGQTVDVALYEAMLVYMESMLPEYEKLGKVRQPTGAVLPGVAPSNVYPTADGQLLVIGANNDGVFRRLAVAAGRQDWVADENPYRTHIGRGANQAQLDGEISAWSASYDCDALLGLLDQAGVPAGRIYSAADIAVDRHVAARGMILHLPEPNLGGETVGGPGVVPRLDGTPGTVRRGGPRLGEHNEEVLGGLLGMPADDRGRAMSAC